MTITCNGSGPVCGAGVGEVGRGAGRRVDGWNSSSIIAWWLLSPYHDYHGGDDDNYGDEDNNYGDDNDYYGDGNDYYGGQLW